MILRDKQAHPEMARAARANAFAVRELRIRAAQAKKGRRRRRCGELPPQTCSTD